MDFTNNFMLLFDFYPFSALKTTDSSYKGHDSMEKNKTKQKNHTIKKKKAIRADHRKSIYKYIANHFSEEGFAFP